MATVTTVTSAAAAQRPASLNATFARRLIHRLPFRELGVFMHRGSFPATGNMNYKHRWGFFLRSLRDKLLKPQPPQPPQPPQLLDMHVSASSFGFISLFYWRSR